MREWHRLLLQHTRPYSLRSETGFAAHGHIRKYDGEPFMPHHVVEGVLELLQGEAALYVPHQEIIV